jgi:hypothetical protein
MGIEGRCTYRICEVGAEATEANADKPGSEGRLGENPIPLSPRDSRADGGGSVFDDGVEEDDGFDFANSEADSSCGVDRPSRAREAL